jgi:hypothetical protein
MSLEQDLARIIARTIKAETEPLKQDVATLKADVADLKARPQALKYCGTWTAEAPVHQQGDCVTEKGHVWIAVTDTRGRPGEDRAWQLAVRAGRDGKDAKP